MSSFNRNLMNLPPITPAPATNTSPEMTQYEEPTDWSSQVESLIPTLPTQVSRQQSPDWETPKAHQKAQKQRIERASKVAKEAKAAATKAAKEDKITTKGEAKAQPGPKPQQITPPKAKVSKGPKPGNRDWIPMEELCRSCGIHAPHRVGIYQYMSRELPYKILNIQRKISKGTATAEDIQLHNGFAAVHTNSPPTGTEHAAGPGRPVNGNPRLQVPPPSGHQQSSNGDKRRRRRWCRHPECPVAASHRRGRYALNSCSTPKEIQAMTAKLAEGVLTKEDYSVLMAYRVVHGPVGSHQGADEIEEVDDCASVASVEIIC